ncbi:MAG: S8 family serine peptidase [Pseudomonadota bacterium]
MRGYAAIAAVFSILMADWPGFAEVRAASSAAVDSGVRSLTQIEYAGRKPTPLARGLTGVANDAAAVQFVQGAVHLDPRYLPVLRGDEGHVLLQFRGPLDVEQQRRLTGHGVALLEYIPHNTWKARVRSASLAAVRGLDFVQAVGSIYPVDKLPAAILAGDFHPRSLNADGSLSLEVYFHPGVDYARAAVLLAGIGAAPVQADFLSGRHLTVRLPQNRVIDLLALDSVAWVEDREAPKAGENVGAAALSHVDSLWRAPLNLSGAGVAIGMWDEGLVDVSHPDLAGHVATGEAGQVVGHATHVAGTLSGSGAGNSSARGMAPAAAVWSYDYFGDPVAEHTAARKDRGIAVANNSWGYLAGWQSNYYNDGYWVWFGGAANRTDPDFGGYSSLTRNWDRLVYDTELVVVKSAGNDRSESGAAGRAHRHYGDSTTLYYDHHDADGDYRSIGQIATAKNVITVGAVDNAGAMTAYSAWGPTNDGRLKPDVVAKGQDVYSTYLASGYTSLNGTSMATPTVSGAIALLVERYRKVTGSLAPPPAHLIRALVANTAADLGTPGPDYAYGWGLLDAQAALKVIDADSGAGRRFITASLLQGTAQRYDIDVAANAGPLKISLAWTDPPGSPGAAAALVNDLDIRLIGPAGTVYYPYSLAGLRDPAAPATALGPNSVDNLEQVLVASPQAGLWQVEVRGSRVQGVQSYSLVNNLDMPTDKTPPGGGYVVVNQGGEYALSPKIMVFLAGYDNQGVTGYYLSENPARPGLSQFTAADTVARLSLSVPYTLSAGDGSKTLYLWLRDASGNISEAASVTVKLDTQPPDAPRLSVQAGTQGGRPQWEWTPGNGMGVFRYKLNDSRLNIGAEETRNLAFLPGAPLSPGMHILYVQERDEAGQWSAVSQMSITVTAQEWDSPQLGAGGVPLAPSLRALTPVNDPLPRWLWNSINGGGIFRLRLNEADLSGAAETTATAFLPPVKLADGLHRLYIQERGVSGLWSPVISFAVMVDTAAPVTTASITPAASTSTQWVSLRCDDIGAGCAATYYTLDGSVPTPQSPRYNGMIPVSASTTLRFLSFDQAGNVEPDRVETYLVSEPAQAGSGGGGGGLLTELLLLICALPLAAARRGRRFYWLRVLTTSKRWRCSPRNCTVDLK